MSAISVIGLGAMGGAIARTLQRAGHAITVWNRSVQRMQPFIVNGATGATSVGEAVEASPVVLVCIDSYATTLELLSADDAAARLQGRTLVQVSTGTPQEAQASDAWCKLHDVAYIDGAIECLPEQVGTEGAQFLFAGPERAYRDIDPYFECLGGDRRYLGENIRAPATLDLAWLSQRLGQMLGALHGICLVESEEVDVSAFAGMLPEGDRARILANRVIGGAYQNPDATVAIWDAVAHRLRKQAADTGIGSEFPDFASDIIGRATQAGYAGEDVAALIKVLRQR